MKLSLATFLLSLAGTAAFEASPDDIHFVGRHCENYYANEPGWETLNRTNDETFFVDSGINFDWFNQTFTAVYINANGNISFKGGIGDYIPNGFTTDEHNMIAPFWADLDTHGATVVGDIHYKTKGDRFIVVWNEVAEYELTNATNPTLVALAEAFGAAAGNVSSTAINDKIDKRNTFQVVISDMESSHPKICFCYCKMEWAQGDWIREEENDPEAQTEVIVPPIPATIGINPDVDTGKDAFLLGRFGYDADAGAGMVWNGFGSGSGLNDFDMNGVGWLDGRSFCFDPSIVDDPPVGNVDFNDGYGITTVGVCGDPHFKTWTGEHFEYHGQCDLVIAKDANFADGLGLDVHIRTKLVRFWSYIKNAVIRIGDDILEIEGSSAEGIDSEVHYWINYEYQGELTEFAGFPVTISSEGTKSNKNKIVIDLSSKYPGQSITLSTFKEFVKVDFGGAKAEAFGNVVGMLGDFHSGKTLARDGATVLDNFAELGHEWQVLPSDGKFFREASEPQFPKKCIDPEDPQGERRRRLAESTISVEEAEAACAGLKNALDRKDCVYDILATQDMDMVGAF